jgi:hypothetical protein
MNFPVITLQPGGSNPPTPTQKQDIRNALGAAPATGIEPSAIAGTAVVSGDARLVSFINASITQLTGTGASSLAAIATVAAPVDRVLGVVISGTLAFYQLRNGTPATSVPGIVRPNDYNASSNPKVWYQIL